MFAFFAQLRKPNNLAHFNLFTEVGQAIFRDVFKEFPHLTWGHFHVLRDVVLHLLDDHLVPHLFPQFGLKLVHRFVVVGLQLFLAADARDHVIHAAG